MRTQPNKTTFPKNQLLAPKIHNVIILDGSGSMSGNQKYSNACAGIRQNLETCKKEGISTYTFVEFNDIGNITTHCYLTPLEKVNLTFNGASGYTPLYRTIGQTLDKLLIDVPLTDKVLVNIFTDGKEEGGDKSKYHKEGVLRNLIKDCESRGFTITFIGTKQDVTFTINNLGIDKSNTLVHDNTGKGVETAFNVQAEATRGYSKRVSKGEDVTLGFYSKTIINND